MEKDRGTSALLTYLGLTILFSTGPYIVMANSAVGGGAGGYVTALMWAPALAAIVTIAWLKLDWERLGFAWRHPLSAWLGYLVPIGYAGLAYAIVWTFGLGGFATPESIAPLAARLGWTITDPARFVPLYFIFTGISAIVVSTAHGLGEEIGWRGFMTPLLYDKFGFMGGTLVTGIIWTAWHVPLILFSNYNNGTPPLFALTCFFIMIVNTSVIMTWLRLRSGSVWPCAILHGSHNLFIQMIFTPLTSERGSITAYAIDEFGFMLPVAGFIFALIFWLNRDKAIAAYDARRARGLI